MARFCWLITVLLLGLLGCSGVQRQLAGTVRLESAGVIVWEQAVEARWPRFAETARVVILSAADTLAAGTVAGGSELLGELQADRLDLSWRLDACGWNGEAPISLRLFALPGQDGLLARGSALLWAGDPHQGVELPAFTDEARPDIPSPERARWVLHYSLRQ